MRPETSSERQVGVECEIQDEPLAAHGGAIVAGYVIDEVGPVSRPNLDELVALH